MTKVGPCEIHPVRSVAGGLCGAVVGVLGARLIKLSTLPTLAITFSLATLTTLVAGVRKAASPPNPPSSSSNTNEETPPIQHSETSSTQMELERAGNSGAASQTSGQHNSDRTDSQPVSTKPATTIEANEPSMHAALMTRAKDMQQAEYATTVLLTVQLPTAKNPKNQQSFTCAHLAKAFECYCKDSTRTHWLPLGPDNKWLELSAESQQCIEWKSCVLDRLERLATNTSDNPSNELNQLLGEFTLLVPLVPGGGYGAVVRSDNTSPANLKHAIVARVNKNGISAKDPYFLEAFVQAIIISWKHSSRQSSVLQDNESILPRITK